MHASALDATGFPVRDALCMVYYVASHVRGSCMYVLGVHTCVFAPCNFTLPIHLHVGVHARLSCTRTSAGSVHVDNMLATNVKDILVVGHAYLDTCKSPRPQFLHSSAALVTLDLYDMQHYMSVVTTSTAEGVCSSVMHCL